MSSAEQTFASNRGRRIITFWLVILVGVAAISCWFVLATPVHAQGKESQGFRLGEATCGVLLFRTEQKDRFVPAPVLETDVVINATGLIARATVRQRFQNPGSDWAEAIYVFPLPETAAVDHLRMRVGERIIEGIIKEREEATKTYEAAKAEGKRATLIHQERPNIFTAAVANIGPGEEVSVEIEYQEALQYDQGQFRLRFPMVVGPRYIPGVPQSTPDGYGWSRNTEAVPDASRVTPPVQHPNEGALNPVRLKIDLAPGFPLARVESRSHKIKTVAESNGRYIIVPEDGPVPADRDFELVWRPRSESVPAAAVFTEQRDGEVYALFMVLPPEASTLGQRVARETILVIDTSGSMHGASIQQAKAAVSLALSRLSSEDSFNIIQFNSVTHTLFSASVPATKENLEKALLYVERLQAQGGTEMLPALHRALDGAEHHQRLRQIIFLTDGAVGNEEQLFSVIRQRLGDSRLFTIGIGSAPNGHFMRKAAEFGRGTFTYIGSTSEVQDKVDSLFRKLEHPALTDVQIDLAAPGEADVFPERVPDLYLGEPLIVAFKSKIMPDRIVLTGRFGKTPWQTVVTLHAKTNREGIAGYWARQKIGSLMDKQAGQPGNDSMRQAVIELALKHHLVSRYTSLVAVDVTPARPAEKPLNTHALKTNLPDGWDYTAVFALPQTATNAQLRLLLGVLLLGAGGMYVRCYRRRRSLG